MIDSYITVSQKSCEEIIISKSRFIGEAMPCAQEADALAFLQSVRDEHRSATHHCYAYIIGETKVLCVTVMTENRAVRLECRSWM